MSVLSLSECLCISLYFSGFAVSSWSLSLSELSESLRVCGERQCWYARISVLASLTCGWLTYSVSISVYESISVSFSASHSLALGGIRKLKSLEKGLREFL